ncbi:MAG: flagellar hook capping FlgD N-terminal domain-containing protein [Planctomycetota bacterium]
MSTVSGIGTSPTSLAQEPTSGVSGLSSDEFLQIIFEELAQQDPLEPNDTNALLEQLSSIRSIESDLDLASRLETIASQGELNSASGLIGDFVSGLTEDNQRVADFVGSVSRTADDRVILNLVGGDRIKMTDVDEILDGQDAQDLIDALAGDEGAAGDDAAGDASGGDDDDTGEVLP